jgi:hypothetical protein
MFQKKSTQETGFQKQGSAAELKTVLFLTGGFPLNIFGYGKV